MAPSSSTRPSARYEAVFFRGERAGSDDDPAVGSEGPDAPVGVPAVGFDALRHFYASLWIRHGESVKTVQARLGHASASETLDTYSHLWPDSDDRTRAAVDGVLAPAADYLRTGDRENK